MKIYDLNNFQLKREIQLKSSLITGFGISTTLGLVAIGNKCDILLYDYNTSKLVAQFRGHTKEL